MGYFDEKKQRYHVIQKSNPITPVAAGNAISYPQIFAGIDLNYTCGNTRLKEELVLSQSGRDALPVPSQFGVSRSDAYLMLEIEFALTPANLQAFARVGNGRVPIKQGNNFVFNGIDRIDFEDADSTLHFFFPEDVAYALADSANRTSVTRVFSSQRGKDYVLMGVPYSWIDAAPKGTLIIDPTVQPVANADVYLYDASNHNSAPDGLSLLVGKFAGTNKKRTFIKFPMTSIPANATVLNAQMKLRYFGNGGSTWLDRGCKHIVCWWIGTKRKPPEMHVSPVLPTPRGKPRMAKLALETIQATKTPTASMRAEFSFGKVRLCPRGRVGT